MKVRLLLAIVGTVLIAGLAAAADKIVYSSNESGNYDIWMMNPDGSGKAQITYSPIDEFSPKISHDGRTIAFTRFDGGAYSGNIYFYDVATGSTTQISSANDVALDLSWSPDDSQIAYSRTCGGRQIAVYDIAAATVNVLTGCSAGSYGAIWHPTDGRIYYWDYIPGSCRWGMYSVPSGGGSAVRTDSRTFWDTEWSFNPTNPSEIVGTVDFGSSCTHGSYLARLNPADDGYTILYGDESTVVQSPSWSPDGSQIALAWGPLVNSVRNIYIYDTETYEVTQLTNLTSGGTYNSIAGLSWGTIFDRGLLLLPSVATKPCDSCLYAGPGPSNPAGIQLVACDLTEEATAATVSLKIPAGVEVCDISFDGLATENWDYKVETVKSDSGFLTVGLANSLGLRIPVGVTTLFNIEFIAARACNVSTYIHWDTAMSAYANRRLEFTDVDFQGFVPVFDVESDSTEIVGYRPGDPNDNGDVTIGDISVLIDHLFISGIKLCNLNSADVNGSCDVTISDVALLIDTLFVSGHALQCGCANQGGPILKSSSAGVSLQSIVADGVTTITINTPVALRGLQLELRGPEGASPVNVVSDKLNLFYGQTEDQIRLGMIDVDGGQTIGAGTTEVIRLAGDYTLISGVVVDNQLRESVALIGSGAGNGTLPTTFSMGQNYPNPFNPMTEIRFALQNATDVRLEVFNVLGQSVATLVERHLEAGEHSATWDATAQASGVYMYRLTAGDFVETKKMLLLK